MKQDDNAISSYSDLNILLVDDNKVNQFLGKKILKNLGITNVDVASDGHTAIQTLQEKKFDVLLTDVEMPGMNGYELTTSVRQFNSEIIIIALTANATSEEKEYALKNGMNDYLSKPYAPDELMNVLQKHCKRHNTFSGAEQENFYEYENPIQSLYKLFNNNRTDVKNLLILLQKQLPECMQQIRDGILNDDSQLIYANAHKLKSTIKLFNDPELFQSVADITEFSRSGKETDKIPSLYDGLNKGVNELMVLINTEIELL